MYKRLAKIQGELLTLKLPKSGYNKFGKYYYHELEDILPVIWRKCYEHHITLVFNFIDDSAILKLKDWETPGNEISVRVPMPKVTPLTKGMNLLQSEGSYITYLKRYLLANTFLIMEEDVVDADTIIEEETTEEDEEETEEEEYVNESSTDEVTEPSFLKNARNLCRKHDGEITADGVLREASGLKAKGVIDRKQEKEIIEYVHEHGVET